MTLLHYLTKRYLAYFFVVNCALTLMYNFIEFVEKLIRFKADSASSVSMFILLNMLPTFFDFIHLSAWLSLCLLLWEMHQRGEWESMQLLSVNQKDIAKMLLKSGVFLSLVSFFGKEIFIYPFSKTSQEYKNQNLKSDKTKKLFGQWIITSENSFIGFDYFDTKTNAGKNFTYLTMDTHFQPQEKIECDSFICEYTSQTVKISTGTRFNFAKNIKTDIKDEILTLPSLFAHLSINSAYPSLQQQFNNILVAASMTSHFPLNQELGKLLSRLLQHIQPMLYVLITISLFFLAPHHPRLRWIFILIPYPLMLILTSMGDFLLQLDFFAGVILIPYLVALIALYALSRRSFA